MAIQFEKDAVDQAVDSLQLNQLFTIVSRSTWISFLAVGLILLTALAWSILGRLPTTVIGRGLLMGEQDTILVGSVAAGVIGQYEVEVGDVVSEGDLIATLENLPLLAEVREAAEATEQLRRSNTQLTQLEDERWASSTQAWTRQQATIASQQKEFKSLLSQQSELLKTQKKLVDQGLIAQVAWLASQEQLSQLETQVAGLDKESEQIHVDRAALELKISQDRSQRTFQILTFQEKTEHLQAQYEEQAEIRAPIDGLIEQVRTQTGDVVAAGMPIAQIKKDTASFAAPMHCIVYVTLPKSKRVRAGQRVHIELTMAMANRYGYMVGTVQQVSMLPASEQDLMLDLANKSMAKAVLAQGPVLRVAVKLDDDSKTASGFQWTTQAGYPAKLTPGTTCDAYITVESSRPIDLIVPWIKSKFYGQLPKKDQL